MSEREEFVRLVHQRRYPVTELCVAFGISEKTGHKWLRRYHTDGRPGLSDRSHAPHLTPHSISSEMQRAIVALRSEHPTWGPKKLRALLADRSPHVSWPAASTIGDVLKREGMIRYRRRKPKSLMTPMNSVLTVAGVPNDVWTTDFKGEFRLGSGSYCYPLTVQDAQSRFLIGCTALLSTSSVPVKIVFTRLFRKYGVPHVIRSDNGIPFSSALALAGLSTLSIWWIRLGIRPERIDKGCPQQNGQHERMHKTLKAEATRPPSSTLINQQKRFDAFRREYNDVRPHEALKQKPPSSSYHPSPKSFPDRLPDLNYKAHLEVRRVQPNGMVILRGRRLWLSKTLIGQDVSFEETDDDAWQVCFSDLVLGQYHYPSNIFIPECCWKSAPDAEA